MWTLKFTEVFINGNGEEIDAVTFVDQFFTRDKLITKLERLLRDSSDGLKFKIEIITPEGDGLGFGLSQ